jgi:hypothetical protein
MVSIMVFFGMPMAKAKEYPLVSLKQDDLDLMSQETFQSLPEGTVFLA